MRRILIVRHGNTFASGEAPRRVGARTDLPLVDSGRAQSSAVGRAFAEYGWCPERVLTGTLRRVRDTAALILNGLGSAVVPETATFLDEIDHGPDENQPEEVVLARIGREALEKWESRGDAPPGWTIDRNMRIVCWRALLADVTHETTLLVTSNGAARFVFLALPDSLAGKLNSLKLRTGAWGHLSVLPDGSAELIEWDIRPC